MYHYTISTTIVVLLLLKYEYSCNILQVCISTLSDMQYTTLYTRSNSFYYIILSAKLQHYFPMPKKKKRNPDNYKSDSTQYEMPN